MSAKGWQVRLSGLVEQPVTLTWDKILALPKSIADARLTSVTRWSVRGQWGGARISDLLAVTGIKAEATHVQFVSYREIYTTCIPLSIAMKEHTLLAYEFDDEALDADYGGPVRAFCPYMWGYKSAKSVIGIRLEDRSIPGYWEVRGYPDSAQITAGRVHDVNTHRWRQIPNGQVIEFLD